MATVSDSPNKPRPSDPLVREVADTIARTGANYDREGSGPGSRFEGRLLEDVQAEMAVRMAQGAAARKYLALLDEATFLLVNLGIVPEAANARRIREQAGLEAL